MGMPACKISDTTSFIGVDVIKHKSADPGVGLLAFGSNSISC
ncbi:hypothetical protein SeHA_C3359 [Salmonella enterica subsp. enterica serovar Heidelberg str. SL476]|uniref:Uncharacterized protein n=1 Tax=Salmonella heidelberg (strain SL476) TaxID=454169 RepID=A0A6C6ZPP7_SALHS|nr:hypothetical protein SeHA_C3359 [Salmonella enterica subsp. enterica serovar Heidelberg str. SL476]